MGVAYSLMVMALEYTGQQISIRLLHYVLMTLTFFSDHLTRHPTRLQAVALSFASRSAEYRDPKHLNRLQNYLTNQLWD